MCNIFCRGFGVTLEVETWDHFCLKVGPVSVALGSLVTGFIIKVEAAQEGSSVGFVPESGNLLLASYHLIKFKFWIIFSLNICRRILLYVKENLCGVLVRQSVGLIDSDFLRLFTISNLLFQDSDSIYLLLQRKYTPKLRKTNIDITYSWSTKIPSCFLPTWFNSCFPLYANQYFSRTHALFAARMTHHAMSQDVPTQTRTHNSPRQFLI